MEVGFRQNGLVRGRNASLTNDFAGALVYLKGLGRKNVRVSFDFFEQHEITFDVRQFEGIEIGVGVGAAFCA